MVASMSPELRLMVSPGETYASMARARGRATLLTAIRRPLLVALVLGASVAKAATGHITPSLLVSATLCWTFVVILQAAIALGLMAGAARRTVGLARAVDLYFAGHAPWSLWLLAAAAWSPSPLGRPLAPLLVVAVVPLFLTARITTAFFREVLEMDPRHAVARTVAQQALTWGSLVILFGTAVAWMPRVLEWVT
jgi:hypothetical protein